MGRALDSRLRERGFESCVLCTTLGNVFHSTMLQFTKLYEYLAIDSGGYLCLHALSPAWLNASQRSQDGVRLNRSARE